MQNFWLDINIADLKTGPIYHTDQKKWRFFYNQKSEHGLPNHKL